MTMHKIAIFSHRCSVKALNKPKGWEIYNLPNQIKTASKTSNNEDLGGFDLKEATTEHPDHLYIKIFAIKKDEPNDNGDAFDATQLKEAAPTFVGVPLFTNHQNDDVEKSRGECVHSWYDTEAGGIYVIGRVDKVAYPKLARGIEEGYISGTSMGCSVEYSLCSVCHNMANTSDEYCTHVSNRKNRKYNGSINCVYHQSKTDTEDKCPLCGCEKEESKSIKHEAQMIYEHNYGLKFIENSFVVNPACHECGVTCVLHVPELQKKVAEFSKVINRLVKDANGTFTKESATAKAIEKLGGINEINSLKSSMSEMETVVKSMLKQKDNVSMEYVSDLVKAMADVQGILDELVEMGYAALPSPPVTAGEEPEVPAPFPEPVQTPEPQMAAPGGGSSSMEDLGGLGNVTLPQKSSNKKEDFSKISENVSNKVSSLKQRVHKIQEKQNNNEIGAIMATDKTTKTAAGTENLEVITEKQLEKKQEDLHPRTESVYEGITESKEQIGGAERSNDTTSDSPQVRLGTYETTTEDQLKTESALGSAIIHFVEYPDVITEKQWDDFSRDIAGDLPEDYTESITQAQIRDLLSKHKFIGDVETITEDQLRNMTMTDGLKRWASADYSLSLMKTAVDTIVDAIVKYKKSPNEIVKAATLINDDSATKDKAAFLAVINSLPQKADEKEALAQNIAYFCKTAATHNKLSAIDALILAASDNGKFAMKAEDLFDSVYHAVDNKIAYKKVQEKVAKRMNDDTKTIISKSDSFNKALKIMDRPEDGKYQIRAAVSDIDAPITDKVAFLAGVKKFAQEMIDDDGVDASAVIKIQVGDGGELIIDIQEGAGEDESVSPDDIGDIIEGPVEDIEADDNGEGMNDMKPMEGGDQVPDMNQGQNLPPGGMGQGEDQGQFRNQDPQMRGVAAAKAEIKQAQMLGGEMGGQGGAAQTPGAGASLPAVPGAEVPPMENFTEDPMADEEGGFDEENLEAKPPGSICPVCGSDDVDIISGKGKCNNCASEMTYKVEVNVTKWTGVTPTGDEAGELGGELGEGEGFEMPTEEPELGAEESGMGGGMAGEAGIPAMAAYTRLLPEALKKIGSQNITLGSVSPVTGTVNTLKMDSEQYVCLDTGTKYKVSCIVSKDGKKAYAQWEWKPKVAGVDCPSCTRAKQRFVKALSSVKLTEAKFNELELKDKVDTIVKLNQSGALTKVASKNGSAIEDYKLAYGNYGDKFPVEACIEKLSRRFGKDAICLSGPDEGENLAESVCNRLKKADVYTTKLATKVASIWSDCDGDEECITDQVRNGYSLRESAVICTTLKSAMVQSDYIFADQLGATAQIMDEEPMEEPIDDMGMGEEEDPFESIDEGVDGGTVTIELPADVAEQLGSAVDEATGGMGEEGMGEEGMGEEGMGEEGIVEEVAPGELEGGEMNDMSPMEGGEAPMDGGSPMDEGNPMDGGEAPVDPMGETKQMTDFETELPEDQGGLGGDPCDVDPCGAEFGGAEFGGGGKVRITVNGVEASTKNKEDFSKEAGNDGIDYEEALIMSGAIGRVGKPQMDLSSVIAAIKTAGEKEISQEKMQDSKDIGTYSAGEGGSLMGHESETIRTPQKPSVPRDNATMGQEPSDLNPQDKPLPVVPSDDATMGHEKEVGLGGGDNRFTGGTDGQGETELASSDKDIRTADADLYHMKGFGNSKDSLAALADRIAKKLEPKKPVADDPDIQPIDAGDGSTIGKEEKFTADEPTNVEGGATESLMGHESETVKAAPKEPADQPDVFTGNAQMGKEELDSEKTTKDKGTVIANSDSESEAYRVAGKMIAARKIDASELQSKVNELKTYKPAQIRDFEKAIFAGQKGLDTVSGGMSQAVQINENSSIRNANEELSEQLQGLFTLEKQNRIASDDSTTQLRKVFGK